MENRYPINPCLECGACCAFFRASFYWAECDDAPGGTVPAELTEPLTPFRRVMKGTNKKNPRCIALEGEIGKRVKCTIYEKRSSVCRAFKVAWEDGRPNPDCDRARAHWGLPPLQPHDIFRGPQPTLDKDNGANPGFSNVS